MIEYDVRLKGFDTLDRDIGEALEQELALIMEEGAERARNTDRFRDGTGMLRQNIHAGTEGSWSGGNLEGVLLADAPHASFVEEGTRAHIIRSKKTGLGRDSRGRFKTAVLGWLRFEAGGRIIFTREVRHPGTKATHFVRDSINAGAASNRLAAVAARAADKDK